MPCPTITLLQGDAFDQAAEAEVSEVLAATAGLKTGSTSKVGLEPSSDPRAQPALAFVVSATPSWLSSGQNMRSLTIIVSFGCTWSSNEAGTSRV
jgi:hypothetical protein